MLGRARPAVLRAPLRARGQSFAAPAEAGVEGQVQGDSIGLEKFATDLANQNGFASSQGHPAHRPARRSSLVWRREVAAMGIALVGAEKTVCPRGGKLRRLCCLYSNEIGRVIQAVEDMGKLDNTLIIYISGDNGTSSEGTVEGTFNQMTAYNGILTLPEAVQMLHYAGWGSDTTYPHMSVAWSWAFDTPFKWTKQVASHFGEPGRAWHLMARPYQGRGRYSHAVPSHNRYRADHP